MDKQADLCYEQGKMKNKLLKSVYETGFATTKV